MQASFIVPVFEVDPEVFKKGIKSLLEQSFKDWEAIFVFDGPDKAATDVLTSFGDKRLKRVEIPHSGAQRARNEGGKQAKGDILWFWDADCVIEPDTCKTFMDEFDKHPEIDFIYSGYKFLDEKGGIPSEPFDPWTLKCANYISTCFPMRRTVYPGWDETLKSLQDWDLWLTVVENGGKGMYIPGYAFSTSYPTPNSISGQGCGPDAWLERVNAVKVKHNIPNRKVCVSSVSCKQEGIRLAKLINADYQDFPQSKPNNYDTAIQIGFSLCPQLVKYHVGIFKQPIKKKIIFWTSDNISEIHNGMSLKALGEYAELLNKQTTQYVEDFTAKKIMDKAGFRTHVLPVPMVNTNVLESLPKEPKVLVDITEDYRQLLVCLEHSLPDIKFDYMANAKPIKEYNALLSLNSERTISFNVKRMMLAGRNIISNIQSPYCGYISDQQELGKFVSELANTIRKRVYDPTGPGLVYWKREMSADKLMGELK